MTPGLLVPQPAEGMSCNFLVVLEVLALSQSSDLCCSLFLYLGVSGVRRSFPETQILLFRNDFHVEIRSQLQLCLSSFLGVIKLTLF
jgi:hypothetical protein